MAERKPLETMLKAYQHIFHSVVKFDKNKDRLLNIDLTENNILLTTEIFNDTEFFSLYIEKLLKNAGALYGIGGYGERRKIYKRSTLFANKKEESRDIHLGIDIWGSAGTPVFAPLGGTVHSFRVNDAFGDYGATIILQHQLDTVLFYTLYGHLSLKDLGSLRTGQFITVGETFAHFGVPKENGYWPPHLHFQIIENMGNLSGDYPGVCAFSEREKYLNNSPDANIILQLLQYAHDM